ADIGVRRISVGSSLARAAWTAFLRAAEMIAKEGSFNCFDGIVPFAEINNFFHGHEASSGR
ncbi:MAG TPA: isocitrate lyase/phosphoenolpyruvate mutase family protein, partial [Terriglobia bacterium]|nr:isocitrate lyase/phosphoenolpyruvate mutase family protein [Terriglobia bacterium]